MILLILGKYQKEIFLSDILIKYLKFLTMSIEKKDFFKLNLRRRNQ